MRFAVLTVLTPCLALATPEVLLPGFTLELVSQHPEVVTPVAVDVGPAGGVTVIESNTHFPPQGYDRAPHDRILRWLGEGGLQRDELARRMGRSPEQLDLDLVELQMRGRVALDRDGRFVDLGASDPP